MRLFDAQMKIQRLTTMRETMRNRLEDAEARGDAEFVSQVLGTNPGRPTLMPLETVLANLGVKFAPFEPEDAPANKTGSKH